MADLETNVVISADTGDLQSGLADAADAVESATGAMRAQLAALAAAAGEAQSRVGAALGQIGAAIGALQAKGASLAGAAGGSLAPTAAVARLRNQAPALGASGGGDDQMRQWRTELQQQLADEQNFFADSKAQELAFWQDKLALTEQGSNARYAVEADIYRLERQLAIQNERDQLADLDADERVTDAAYARKKAAIEDAARTGQISATAEVAEEQGLVETKWALDQDYFDKKLAAAENDSRTRQKLLDEEQFAYQKFLADKQKLDTQAVLDSQKAWANLLRPIETAFDRSITGMVMGTTTLEKAVANIAQSIVAEFVDAGVKMLTHWIATELGMTAATEAGATARTAAESQGLLAGLALKALTALKNIATDSAQTFAGIFAFMAPLLGPAAAGPAAAGAATVAAAAGSVASAAGGWVVPSDQLALVHRNEMVLPAGLSQGLQGMIANGGGGAGNPVTINVSAIDSRDVKRFFEGNGTLLVGALNKAMRNGMALRGL
jgi:hypothetical protein